MSGRAGHDGVDGRLTGTRGTVSLLVGIFGMREIPRRVISGVFATYEGNTKLSALLNNAQSLTQTPHGTDTAACHGRRPRRPSGQGTHPGTVARVLRSGCYTTGSLTLS